MDLAEDALEAAETYTFPAITDNSDQVMNAKGTDLFVSRNKVWVAERLLKSTLRVGTPNNDANLVKGRYNLHVLSYMDTAYNAYWFLKDAEINDNYGFVCLFNSIESELRGPFVDFDTECIKYALKQELAAGHNNWQSYVGAKGTNLA